jgi:hypothetical protein
MSVSELTEERIAATDHMISILDANGYQLSVAFWVIYGADAWRLMLTLRRPSPYPASDHVGMVGVMRRNNYEIGANDVEVRGLDDPLLQSVRERLEAGELEVGRLSDAFFVHRMDP